ncbi:hypothetical protein J2Z60_000155 [Lactobacillus colini]|uniref:DUF2758 domain-containing protein n=1 Tax=Lactobacillus colini TaxID=1819254 RepID=A0ABS4MBE6_9LACO|nr:hypothetical protein [Lactobacillus colini]MBP2056993.1 hypothetical protein [Lactobacillus colini]
MKIQVFERNVLTSEDLAAEFNEWLDLHKKNIKVNKLNYGYSRQGYLTTIVVEYDFKY